MSMQSLLHTSLLVGLVLAVPVAPAFADVGGHQGRGRAGEREQIARWADRLASELEHLLEDVSIDLRGPQQRKIYEQVDEVLREVTHFQKVIRSDADRGHLYKDFQAMDRKVHELLNRIRQVGGGEGALSRGLSRVRYADQQLHYIMSEGDKGPDRVRERVARQAHALEEQSRDLYRSARYAFGKSPRGREILATLENFAKEAEHFHKAVEKGADRGHVRDDFRALRKSWQQVANAMNNLPRGQGYYLRRQASRVDQIHANLHRMLGLETERPTISY